MPELDTLHEMAIYQPSHIHPCLQACCKQVHSAKLAMEKQRGGGRGVPEIPVPAEDKPGVANTGGEIRGPEIVGAGVA